MKAITAALTGIIAGVFLLLVSTAAGAIVDAFILGFVLDPFLAIIDIPVLTERLGGLGFGGLFILVFTLRLLIIIFMPGKPDKKNGASE
jgi:hypothetical protein